ncbi:hypothetical protein OAP56_02045 [Rickettsiaceae bacterium]|nr:hypothetical protein [Rickettsiaceae bacterium]
MKNNEITVEQTSSANINTNTTNEKSTATQILNPPQIPEISVKSLDINNIEKSKSNLSESFQAKLKKKIEKEVRKNLEKQLREKLIQEEVHKRILENKDIEGEIQKRVELQRNEIIEKETQKRIEDQKEEITAEIKKNLENSISEYDISRMVNQTLYDYNQGSENSSIDLNGDDENDIHIDAIKNLAPNQNILDKTPASPRAKKNASQNLVQELEDHETIDQLAEEFLQDLKDDHIKITSVKQLKDILKNPEKEEYKLEIETIQHLKKLDKEEKKELFNKIADIENFKIEDIENPSLTDRFLSFFKDNLQAPLMTFINKADDAFDELVEKGAAVLKEEVKENMGSGTFSQTVNEVIDGGKDAMQNLYEPGDLVNSEQTEQQVIGGNTQPEQA